MSAGLAPKDTLRLIDTHPRLMPMKNGGTNLLFPSSGNVNSPSSGLGWTLTNLFFRNDGDSDLELVAEAVDVGALAAVESNRVRALVLVRSTEAGDEASVPGALSPANVRGFLAALRVPLFYWTVGPSRERAADPWGEPTPIRGWGGVHLAVAGLLEALHPQFLVWIEGLHKPSDVELAPAAPAALSFAGSGGVELTYVGSRPSRRASPAGAG
jgi:hypothetical protein